MTSASWSMRSAMPGCGCGGRAIEAKTGLSPTAALAALALPFIVSDRVIATAPPFAAGLGVCFASDLPALSAFLVAMADSCVEPVELMSTTKEWVPDRQAKKEQIGRAHV